jgi:L,D-transpeptidase-like protein
MRGAAITLAVAGLCLVSGAAQASAAAPDGVLSNEKTKTTWAHPRYPAEVLKAPEARSKRVARLRRRTEDGFKEVYVVLRRRTDSTGQRWLKIRLPARPNGRIGWVREGGLGPLRVSASRLVIDRRTLKAAFFRNGKRIWGARVGVGAPGTATPRGRFWVREVFRVRPGSIYGPFAIGTSAYSRLTDWPGGGVVGIHGTNQPELIPGRPSHGCVRMRNRDIRFLAYRIGLGTPIRIR